MEGYELDFDLIKGILTFIAGIGATLFGQGVQRRWSKQDRAVERLQSLEDKNRDERRTAYADLIQAANNFVESSELFTAINRVLKLQFDEAYESYLSQTNGNEEISERYAYQAQNQDLLLKSRGVMDAMTNAATSLGTKTTAVLLLESDKERIAQVKSLVGPPINTPQGREDLERFATDIAGVRTRLNALTDSLTGAFSIEPVTALVTTKPARKR